MAPHPFQTLRQEVSAILALAMHRSLAGTHFHELVVLSGSLHSLAELLSSGDLKYVIRIIPSHYATFGPDISSGFCMVNI